jgi:hypothetical protein
MSSFHKINNALFDIFQGYKKYYFNDDIDFFPAYEYANKILSINDINHPLFSVAKKWKEELKQIPLSYKKLYFIMIDNNKISRILFHKYANCIRDRFGFFEEEQLHPLPEFLDSTLYEETSKRVRQLGEKNILWSGGIDSTYIICSYIKEKVPFNVVCDDNSINDNIEFYKWMLKNNINIIHFDNIHQAYNIPNMVSGYLADSLFAFNCTKIPQLENNISFYDSMIDFPNRDELYDKIISYGKLLNKPTNTSYEIVRLLNFGLEYIHSCNEINYFIFPNHHITTFFNTKAFSDLSWSKYWYQTSLDGKPEMKKFICDVTQDDNFMYTLKRNRCKMKKRKEHIKYNYVIPYIMYD